MNINDFRERGLQVRRKKAKERREKVAKLKAKGMSGTQIAAELNEKPRTIYQDFSILKRQSQ